MKNIWGVAFYQWCFASLFQICETSLKDDGIIYIQFS